MRGDVKRPVHGVGKAAGIIWDLAPQDVPLENFTGGKNVLFRNGNAARANGDLIVYNGHTVKPEFGFHTGTQANGIDYWLICGVDGVQITNGAQWWTITPPGWIGTSGLQFHTGGLLNGIVFLNDPGSGAYYWDGDPSNAMQPLPDWPAGERCQILVAYKNFLVGLNWIGTGTDLRYFLRWSDAAEPGSVPDSWTPAEDNFAGSNSLASPEGSISAAKVMGDSLMIYKLNSTHAMQFVGGSVPMVFREVFQTRGALGQNLVANWKNVHVMFTADNDWIMHDGVNVESLINGKAQEYLKVFMEQSAVTSAWIAEAAVEQVLMFAFPRGGDTLCTQAILYEPDTGDIGTRELPKVAFGAQGRELETTPSDTWDDAVGVWDTDLATWDGAIQNFYIQDLFFMCPEMTANGAILQAGADGAFKDDDGLDVPIDAFLEREGVDFGQAYETMKSATECWPRMFGVEGDVVEVRVGHSDATNLPIKYEGPYDFVIGVDKKVDVDMCTGRVHAVRIDTTGGHPWRLEGYSLVAALGGRY